MSDPTYGPSLGYRILIRHRRKQWIAASAGARVGTPREVADALGAEFDRLLAGVGTLYSNVETSGMLMDALRGRPLPPVLECLRLGVDHRQAVADELRGRRLRAEDEQTRRRQAMRAESWEPATPEHLSIAVDRLRADLREANRQINELQRTLRESRR